MKDRQFMVVLALVVAAGLVMGLVAFRMTGGSPAQVVAAGGTAAVANDGAPHPSAADEISAQPADAPMAMEQTTSRDSEPGIPASEPPEMRTPSPASPPDAAAPPESTAPASDTVQ